MLEHFIRRNLNNTVSFLLRTGTAEAPGARTMPADALEQLSISYQNLGKFCNAYSSLLCPESRANLYKVVFCKCCSSPRIFIRNHSLLSSKLLDSTTSSNNRPNAIHSSPDSPAPKSADTAGSCGLIIKMPGFRRDPFLDFIEARIRRDPLLAIEVINQVPLFWDAYLLLGELTDTFVHLESPLSSYFYMHMKISRDIDPPELKSRCDPRSMPYKLEEGHLNMLAAFHYCSGNSNEALRIFRRISSEEHFDISYFEFYAMILYSKSDPSLVHLCEDLSNFHRDEPETLVALGIYKSSIGSHEEARNIFKKALRRKKTSDVHGLLAHTYIKLNDHELACSHFQEALKTNLSSFRALYTAAQGYFIMGKKEVSLWYCRRALEERNDGGIWKLMGRIHMALEEYGRSLKCFEAAERLKEFDALLYMADVHKKTQRPEKALELYEKYVSVGEKNRAAVAKYLIEYYEEQGNTEKSNFYRKLVFSSTTPT